MADAAAALSRQRIDYIDKPDGSVDAVLTITLPGGVTKRYTANVHPAEAQAISGEIIGAELLLNPEVGSFFGKAFKKVGQLAKKVASSKVFALAAKGLAIASPLLGPLAPAALGAAAGLGVAAKLAKAGVAAAHGAKSVAAELTKSAHSDAVKLTKTPAGAAALLQHANNKRLGAEKVADKSPTPPPRAAAKPKPKPAPKPAPPRPSSPAPSRAVTSDVLSAARAGRVRSNDGRPVTADQLLAAHASGRFFWAS